MHAFDPARPYVFVTVGTTSFDALVSAITAPECVAHFAARNIHQMLIQFGRGRVNPASRVFQEEFARRWGEHVRRGSAASRKADFVLEAYDYKPSLHEDMLHASLVVSHGGAGTILEALRAHKPLLVVVNELLADNHQYELAEQLQKEGHLFCSTAQKLNETLATVDFTTLTPFPPGSPALLVAFVEKELGF